MPKQQRGSFGLPSPKSIPRNACPPIATMPDVFPVTRQTSVHGMLSAAPYSTGESGWKERLWERAPPSRLSGLG
eukprot:362103-Chlamydomonas_euryale.AAC.3